MLPSMKFQNGAQNQEKRGNVFIENLCFYLFFKIYWLIVHLIEKKFLKIQNGQIIQYGRFLAQ
jgi:hypothetical protein